MTDMLSYVRFYCSLGWSVIPVWSVHEGRCACPKADLCKSPGKHPVFNGWQRSATSEYSVVRNFWEEVPDANIGIVCGAPSGGLVVVDVDGYDGKQSLERLQAKHGAFPDVPTVQTGSGGLHYFFHSDARLRNSVKKVPGLDMRADGGFVVAAPSKHRSGNLYDWLRKPSLGESIADLPLYVQSALQDGELEFDAASWLASQAPAISGSGGDKHTYKITCGLIRYGKLRTWAEWLKAITPWNERCQPQWSEAELRRKFDHALAQHIDDHTVSLPRNKSGKAETNLATVIKVLSEDLKYQGLLRENIASSCIFFKEIPLEDKGIIDIKEDLINRYEMSDLRTNDVWDGVIAVANRNSFSSVVEDISKERWDGVDRLSDYARQAFGVHDYMPNRIMYRWFIACVARACNPGVKADNCLILQGKQGIGKSTFFKAIAGATEHFNDSECIVGSTDFYQAIGSCWIKEFPEIDGVIASTKSSTLRSVLSSSGDTYRAPYGRTTRKHPRRSVIVGTTNHVKILRDETGERRMWPFRTEYVDMDFVEETRGQVLAQALVLYNAYLRDRNNTELHWYMTDEESREIASTLHEEFKADGNPMAYVAADLSTKWFADHNIKEVQLKDFMPYGFDIHRDHLICINALENAGWVRTFRNPKNRTGVHWARKQETERGAADDLAKQWFDDPSIEYADYDWFKQRGLTNNKTNSQALQNAGWRQKKIAVDGKKITRWCRGTEAERIGTCALEYAQRMFVNNAVQHISWEQALKDLPDLAKYTSEFSKAMITAGWIRSFLDKKNKKGAVWVRSKQ